MDVITEAHHTDQGNADVSYIALLYVRVTISIDDYMRGTVSNVHSYVTESLWLRLIPPFHFLRSASRSHSRSRSPRSRSYSRSPPPRGKGYSRSPSHSPPPRRGRRRSYSRSYSRSRSRSHSHSRRHKRYSRSRSRSYSPYGRKKYGRGRNRSRSPMSNRRRHQGNRVSATYNVESVNFFV